VSPSGSLGIESPSSVSSGGLEGGHDEVVDAVSAGVRPCVSAGEGERDAVASSPLTSTSGSRLPRTVERRRIPVAALAETSKRGSTVASKISDKEHSTASLGHSEVACVENSPPDAIPEVGQSTDNDSHVSPAVRR
jgi:hypothetical protein